ncbi:CUB domain-containing protein 1 precursor [Triplophysa rosa]|uniref:CUB domain-containing protein 1 n=1 Tax=Triplophysa rosa TaxID=992332 RepID=A0A9W7T5L0_TRIRA|nr:CUB domain-containing protein 1 precursor [Triplophysa rosa]
MIKTFKKLTVILYRTLANIIVNFNEKSSTLDLFSPKHPYGFPSKTEMLWSFNVPPSYYTSLSLLSYTLPTCLNPYEIPAIVYTWSEKRSLITALHDSQPSMEPGNFNLSIRNCEIFQQNTSQKCLMVHIQISIIKHQKCIKHPKSACVLKSGWLTMDTVTITSGSHFDLYFFACTMKDLELTVIQTIECKSWQKCTNTPFPLNFSCDLTCIHGDLKTMTWHLHGPDSSSVELVSPTGGLCYSLPGQKCNSNFLLDVSHDNLGITTVAWPSGMTPSSTVSWIVTLDPQFKCKLEFKNISRPKCKEVRTTITVQSIRSQMMLYSTKEDGKIKDLEVSESFSLNMTNCKSTTGDFRAMMQITVQSKRP